MSAQLSNIKIYIELSLYQSISVYLSLYPSLYTVTICLLSARVIKHTIDKSNVLSINSNYKLFPHYFVSSVQHLTEKPCTQNHSYFTVTSHTVTSPVFHTLAFMHEISTSLLHPDTKHTHIHNLAHLHVAHFLNASVHL